MTISYNSLILLSKEADEKPLVLSGTTGTTAVVTGTADIGAVDGGAAVAADNGDSICLFC